MLLPESVLLGLFPQGLILSKPASWEGGDDGVFTVDVSVAQGLPVGPSLICLSYRSTPLCHLLVTYLRYTALCPTSP
jgi:hypothetical protein